MAIEREKVQKHKRSHHTDLRPLATVHASVVSRTSSYNPARGYGPSTSPMSSKSATSLASPSLAAVRKYYRDHGLRTAFQTELSPRDHMVYFSDSLPRRHSILSPGGLAARMKEIAVSSPVYGPSVEQVREYRSIAEVSRDTLLDGVNRSELAKLGGVVSRRPSSPYPNIFSSVSARTSSNPTRDRLRIWGPTYFGNVAVADLYVKAVQLRRLVQVECYSKSDPSEHGAPLEDSGPPSEGIVSTSRSRQITVRARVLPRAKERKPFLIQRCFNLDEMQASALISKVGAKPGPRFLPNHDGGKGSQDLVTQTLPERSKSDSSAKPFKMPKESKPHRLSYDHNLAANVSRTTGKRILVMPIHVEYALYYLPVLAALMFSGHLRKGDALDLPMPNPWAWRDVVSYIYTGQGVMTPAMKENILYLGGRVEG